MHIDYSQFGDRARSVIQKAHTISRNCHFAFVDPAVVMVALQQEDRALFEGVLNKLGVSVNDFCQLLAQKIQQLPKSDTATPAFNASGNAVVQEAIAIAHRCNSQLVTIDHLLLALTYVPSLAQMTCATFHIDKMHCADAITAYRREMQQRQQAQPTHRYLDRYARNLNNEAAEGRIEQAIGRDQEMLRILEILARKAKNNPMLVGEPGTGKTAIIEGLACKIQSGDVQPEMASIQLYSLDLPALIAGASAVGEFEERLKNLLTEITESEENIVLFIDEVHQLVGAGSVSGAMDAANILKPELSRGKLKIIGATTEDEYRQYIEKDKALVRRFQKVTVDEPAIDDAIAMLRGIANRYEEHHHLHIQDEALVAAVKLSARYITDRYLPDKAIDLIDEGAAHLRLTTPAPHRDLSKDDIQQVIERATGIPVAKMNESDEQRLLHIEDRLRQNVIGQDRALSAIANAIRRNRMGMSDENRPIGSFLFLGPTGVGKTESCKALAEILFDSRDKIVRIDMSEYQQEHSAARLFGAPPGYVGYEQGGQLTEAVRRKPYSVILFDELEKAHPKIFETLLQILDDGRMTDGHGRVVNFKNTIIVMTSNVPSLEHLRQRVAPEFINRIDDIVIFDSLQPEHISQIADMLLNKQVEKLSQQDITVSIDSSVCAWIAATGYNPEYGARPIKRTINTHLLNPLSLMILNGQIDRNQQIYVTIENNKIVFHN